MTTPTMSWAGDGPDVPAGTATFKAAGLIVTMRLPSFNDAFVLQNLMTAAHHQGLESGRRAVAQLVTGTVKEYAR